MFTGKPLAPFGRAAAAGSPMPELACRRVPEFVAEF